ncbi:Asp-tRNA(Asn)/Glu-tRNA(Gln) amidotransferase subunit GatB [Brevundimonas sp.]|uniref:Asp-tRNA(Asn)/Glu-tRNA(Gln) amidotransferase subunit GatB n=1 Tax=Brevundimonas sp. TaxID=1871086 RepID=UPI00198AEC4A|nr:Asp-tRNA(Asn)/Glu-tRNA(Gln) amidotransferase subunit GatB [Brevundimonas sp.]MBD3835553.1 Asp-tRNA(Asn)/Glu-tRNA(Gln) amidotransferase subunit GatB [Brevundimonas sp.]
MSDNSKLIQGRTGDWEIVMGLEIHAQVASKAKLFSGAAVGFGAGPNEQVSLVDAGFPGMLPTLNKHCVEQAVKTGLGLRAKINRRSQFDRKNYFYPDLPTGYQISQLFYPIVGEGVVEVEAEDGSFFNVGIERLHLEQDAGKLIHDLSPTESYVDLNRAGTALMEIVSKPDLRSPEEAVAYVKKIRTILIYLGTCDGDMEKGNLRADVNVSVCRAGNYDRFKETGDFSYLGTRCEIKNVNSFRFISQAIQYEARRQIEIVEDGGAVVQETRLFDPTKGETRSMRSKEEAMDYRYFPDPDLLPLDLEEAWIADIKASLPELPDEKRRRFMGDYGLSQYDAGVLISEQAKADFFEKAATGRDAKLVANWVNNELSARVAAENLEWSSDGVLNAATTEFGPRHLQLPAEAGNLGLTGQDVQFRLTPAMLSEHVELIENGTISSKIAKEVFDHVWNGEGSPAEVVEKHGLKQVTDTGAIEKAVDEIIAANPDKAAAVAEKPQAIGWFVGQVMKATGGKANPAAVNDILKARLGL